MGGRVRRIRSRQPGHAKHEARTMLCRRRPSVPCPVIDGRVGRGSSRARSKEQQIRRDVREGTTWGWMPQPHKIEAGPVPRPRLSSRGGTRLLAVADTCPGAEKGSRLMLHLDAALREVSPKNGTCG